MKKVIIAVIVIALICVIVWLIYRNKKKKLVAAIMSYKGKVPGVDIFSATNDGVDEKAFMKKSLKELKAILAELQSKYNPGINNSNVGPATGFGAGAVFSSGANLVHNDTFQVKH